jgi:hypothetical protein
MAGLKRIDEEFPAAELGNYGIPPKQPARTQAGEGPRDGNAG